MKKHVVILVILLFTLASTALAQKMTVKDSDAHILMEVNDEGEVGSITLPSGAAPSTTTYKLYNVSGALYWNGSALGMAGSAGGWTDEGTVVNLTTSTDKVGIGVAAPAYPLDVDSTIGISNTQILYLPDQSKFPGTLYLGDGGGSLESGSLEEGRYNTAIGLKALNANTTGYHNTATGYRALNYNTTGMYNTVSGAWALYYNTLGDNNVGIGKLADGYNQEGSSNTIIGSYAARGNSPHDKSGNVIIGYRAGYLADEAANRNIFIGYQAGYSETDSCKLYIENSNSTSPLIGGDFEADELYFNGDVGIRKTSPGAALDVDGRIHAAAHAADKGLRIPTNAGVPGLVTGTSEGDIVWDSSNDNLYVYDGTGFSQISGGGGGLWESGTWGVYEDDAGVIVGIDQPETISNAVFTFSTGDLFIQDELGVEGNVYTDGSFIAGSSLSLADGSITQSAGSALTMTLGGGSGDDFIVDTSTLVVESDNDRVGIGDTSPTHTLDVAGKIGIDDTQVLYLPNQTNFFGTLILGDGGGSLSGSADSTGWYNTAVGIGALNANETGHSNTASGYRALYSNTDGYSNTAIGKRALYSNTGGHHNTAVGSRALYSSLSSAHYNTASGYQALFSNGGGDYNVAIGMNALYSNTTGNYNVCIGNAANFYNQGGSTNTIIGHEAGKGSSNHSKSGNVFIGHHAGYTETGDNKLYIENTSSSSPLIGGDFSADELYFNGDVGIKTMGPNSELDVNGTVEMTGFKLTTSPTSGYVLTSDASGVGTWQAAAGGGGDFSNGGEAGGGDRTLGNTDSYDLGFLTNNQSRLHIQNDGKVGIGDTSPTHTLDVAGKIGINDTQVLYLPDQTDFTGTLFIGDGGGSLSHIGVSDGRYNTAVGIEALNANTTGADNTASGYKALVSNTTGHNNTASGSGANYFNQAGSDNTIIGYQAGRGISVHNKSRNVFIGYRAGYTTGNAGNDNIFIGYMAGYSETGSNKLYIENSSSSSPLIGGDFSANEIYLNGDVGIGDTSPTHTLDVAGKIGVNDTQVLYLPDQTDFTGTLYLGDGGGSLSHTGSSEGYYNTAVGIGALNANTTGRYNTASGNGALYYNTTGSYNTTSGSGALFSNTTGNYNVGIGHYANLYNQAGSDNTIIGYQAGQGTSAHDKSGNVLIGYQAGYNTDEADNYNILIGYQAGYSETGSNKLYIENSNSSSPLIGGDFSTDRVGINTNSPSVTLEVSGTDAVQFPVGTTAQRPSSPSAGMIRFNSTTSKFEGYDGTAWVNLH